jgi:adenylate cyclase
MLVLGAYVVVPPALRPTMLTHLEYLAYDWRMQLASPSLTTNPLIAVIDIDNESLEKVGRWPWSREKFAELVTNLKQHHEVIGMGLDVLFVDEACQGTQADQTLSDALSENLPVMAVSFQVGDDEALLRSGELGKGVTLSWANGIPPRSPWWGQAYGYVGNLGGFLSSNVTTGHISPQRDLDGKVRRLKPIYQWGQAYYDTLALAVMRQAQGVNDVEWDGQLAHWLDSPHLRIKGAEGQALLSIPISKDGDVLIPYSNDKTNSAYERISAYRILEKDPSVDLWGKFVLIGSSATGQADVVASPLRSGLPGVEVHAAMLAAMLDQQNIAFKVQPANEPWLQLALLFIILVILWLARWSGVWLVLVVGPVLLVTWGVSNYLLWTQFQLAVEVLPPVLLIIMVMAYLVIGDLLDINARHQHVRKMFGYYLPAPVVQRLANDRSGVDWLKAERKDMTVLFADIQGFTTMADTMSPEAVASITWELFSGLTEVIHQHGGTVDKYMGDAVMAFWGAPLHDNDHALHAVEAAKMMQLAVQRMNQAIFAEKNIQIRLGIGINTGSMLVGNLGSAQRHAYTVMGAVVNTASAVQQLTRAYDCDILVGEETAQRLLPEMVVDLGAADSKKLLHKINIYAVR